MTEEKRDLNTELSQLDSMISDLKVQYEQYFSSLTPLPPDKLHANVKRTVRNLMRAPFRSSAINFRLKALVHRYQALDTYWRRVLREREEGTYHKDVFRANLREQIARETAHEQTAQGLAEKRMQALFRSYREALERTSGKTVSIEFEAFKRSLVERAKDLKEKHPGKKISFKVAVKSGKVALQASLKE